MRSTNPRFLRGHSRDSPVSRILEALTPLITGEIVTANAIGNQLIPLARAGLGSWTYPGFVER
ncbi:MAG: hypothetical protein JO122_17835 [Acetobacteraceae bacterium]|nr:hypothetical protein [Acetobacteraceae bacterium]